MAELIVNGFTLKELSGRQEKHIIWDTKSSVIWQGKN